MRARRPILKRVPRMCCPSRPRPSRALFPQPLELAGVDRGDHQPRPGAGGRGADHGSCGTSPDYSRTMKEKSHRATRRCYRSGVEALRGTQTRRLDGHSLYSAQHPPVWQIDHLVRVVTLPAGYRTATSAPQDSAIEPALEQEPLEGFVVEVLPVGVAHRLP